MNPKVKWLLTAVVLAAVVAGGLLALPGVRGLPAVRKLWSKESRPPAPLSAAEEERRIRPAAMAGMFYPADPDKLGQAIDGYLAAAKVEPIADLRALVCPHAGYEFSGPVAAFGYKLLQGRAFQTVIVLAPSHTAYFPGASVTRAAVYQTPLGDVPIAPVAATLARRRPLVPEPACTVQRPNGWTQSPRHLPRYIDETPETWEHAAEVQVPFLQRVLGRFDLVSVVYGEVEPAAVAAALEPVLNDQTFIIASSDLSHYKPYDDAKAMDTRTVQTICNLDLEAAARWREEACGRLPIRTVMHLAKQYGWKAKLLDYRNSGDTAGNKAGVVGYAAIAFYGPPATPPPPEAAAPGEYSAAERAALLVLARRTLKEVTATGRQPAVDPATLPRKLAEPRACFVTLTREGGLRGCIGNLAAQGALYRAVIDNTESAALKDHRFRPVREEEAKDLEIEVSVLSEPLPLAFTSPEDLLAKLQPRRDGVVLMLDAQHQATYLPQVWEQIPDKVAFLNTLAEKAGCPADAWRQAGVKVAIYHAEAFAEEPK